MCHAPALGAEYGVGQRLPYTCPRVCWCVLTHAYTRVLRVDEWRPWGSCLPQLVTSWFPVTLRLTRVQLGMPSEPEGTAGEVGGGGTQADGRPCGGWPGVRVPGWKARPGVSSVLRQDCLARAWRDEAHLAWGCGRRVEGTIGGSAASASDHLHLGPGRGLRRRGTRVRARGGRGWGSGLGLPASHTTCARDTQAHLGPPGSHVHHREDTSAQLGHTCTHPCPFGPVALTHTLRGHTSSHARPHGNGGG